MYRKLYPWMFLLVGVLIGMVASGRIVLRAQEGGQAPAIPPGLDPPRIAIERAADARQPAVDEAAAPAAREPVRPGQPSVQDLLVRPYRFTFNRPTTLAQVCLHLKQTLGISVVLDVAALERQDVDANDTVRLELDGARLKTGLKLLLDQVGLTYQAVPDDNLLIITDRQGSDDPLDRIWNELRAMHRELHDVQDAMDDLTDALYGEQPEGPRVRKPTIIEEKPDAEVIAPEAPPAGKKGPKDPAQNPGDPDHPRGARPRPPRIPLAHPGRSV